MKYFLASMVFGLILGGVSLVNDNSAYGLTCEISNMTDHFANSDAVFMGKAISKEYHPEPRHEDRQYAVTLFSVIEPFKGIHQKQFDVISSEWFWGPNFTEGLEYVVFANYDDEGRLRYALCTPASLASESDLELIRNVSENYILSPRDQMLFGTDAGAVKCKDSLVLILKSSDGSSACVSSESVPKLVERRWGIDYESLASMIEDSDEIITAMVVGEEILPNGNRNVWLGTYEWLKSGVYDENQLFLEQDKTSNPQAFSVKFSRGEEVLLFVKAIDEKRGAYDIFPTGDIPPQKYPIGMRDAIVGITKPDYSGIKESDFSSARDCSQKDLDGDSYWHCSSDTPFYVPIETTMSLVKEEILRHISEQYFDEHFDLVSSHDVSVVNGKETPTGQSITFVYTIDDMRFVYSADTYLEREFDEVYLRFVSPKQLNSIMHDEEQIEKLAYSCLDSEDYKIYWQPYRIANHVDEGFSPIIAGTGPPTVYDRWSDDPVQRSEKTFRIWLANGEAECRESNTGEFEPDKLARQENILLIDSTEFQRIKGSK